MGGMTVPPEKRMTVNQLMDILTAIVAQEPRIAALPVTVYSDSEGNDCHYVRDVGIDSETVGSPALGVVIVPHHGSVEGWWS